MGSEHQHEAVAIDRFDPGDRWIDLADVWMIVYDVSGNDRERAR